MAKTTRRGITFVSATLVVFALFLFLSPASKGEPLKQEFIAFMMEGNPKNPMKLVDCLYEGVVAAHGEDTIRDWMIAGRAMKAGKEIPPNWVAIGFKITPVLMACDTTF